MEAAEFLWDSPIQTVAEADSGGRTHLSQGLNPPHALLLLWSPAADGVWCHDAQRRGLRCYLRSVPADQRHGNHHHHHHHARNMMAKG